MTPWLLAALVASAMAQTPSDLTGRVEFAGLAVPGVLVTATQGNRVEAVTSGDDGHFRLAALPDGVWRLNVRMRGFDPVERDVALPQKESLVVVFTMQPHADIVAASRPLEPAAPKSPLSPPPAAVDDAVILLGTVTNGGATPFAQPRAVGNARPPGPALYTGSVGANLANSAWNAKPYSFGGDSTAADTGSVQLNAVLTGPLRLPWILKSGPRFTLTLQRGVASSAVTQSARVPTQAERVGDFSTSSSVVRDPLTGAAFAGNVIPADRLSPQALALLTYYPLPGNASAAGTNFERPIVTTTRTWGGRFSTTAPASPRNQMAWNVGVNQATTTANNLFDFTNRRRQTTVEAGVSWMRTVSGRASVRSTYQFSRQSTTLTPHFARRVNVSGDAGLSGNDQRPENWGPPTLQFPGIASLGDAEYQHTSLMTHTMSSTLQWRRGRTDLSAGINAKVINFDQTSQFDPRGTLSFTGAATGSAFADFLLGLPTTSTLAVNDQDVQLRGRTMHAFVMADYRLRPGITVNAGLRWEYEPPFVEADGRLATALRPDRSGLQPRLAVSWRPRLSSSLVFRAGYGLYRNLGTYQSLALLLAQQPPYARTLNVRSGADARLTLANPFPDVASEQTPTVAIDPRYKAAFVHSWQVTVQRELPASLTVSAGYFGDRGTDLMQAYVPDGAGYVFITSGGRSDRHAGTFTIRRRLHRGLAAGVEYTLSSATDNGSTFSNQGITPASLVLVENWRNRDAERGPSQFDQRHRLSAQVQYTTAFGVQLDSNLTWGSGLPFTPLVFSPIGASALVGVRPSLTGVSPAPVLEGTYANEAAYAEPAPGTFGNAGRNSIRGPSQFSLDLTATRLFTLRGRLRLEWRIVATNVLNRVTFSTINTTVGSPLFGRPTRANEMRRLVTRLEFRF